MAAGMHLAGDGGFVRPLGQLGHGERIHVGAQPDACACRCRPAACRRRRSRPGRGAPRCQASSSSARRCRLVRSPRSRVPDGRAGRAGARSGRAGRRRSLRVCASAPALSWHVREPSACSSVGRLQCPAAAHEDDADAAARFLAGACMPPGSFDTGAAASPISIRPRSPTGGSSACRSGRSRDGHHAVASLIINQASFAVQDALADDLGAAACAASRRTSSSACRRSV